MKMLLEKITICLFALMLTSCALVEKITESSEGELIMQYATVKLIREVDAIDGEEVIAFVDKVRPLVESHTGTVEQIMGAIRAEVDWDDLLPEDRFIVAYLFDTAEERLNEKDLLSEDVRANTMQLLDWVEEAAVFSI